MLLSIAILIGLSSLLGPVEAMNGPVEAMNWPEVVPGLYSSKLGYLAGDLLEKVDGAPVKSQSMVTAMTMKSIV